MSSGSFILTGVIAVAAYKSQQGLDCTYAQDLRRFQQFHVEG